MIKWLFGIRQKNNVDRYNTEDLNELKNIWVNLDPALQECAMEEFVFGRKQTDSLKLNEVGIAQLIQHLDKHGFEIRKKL